MDPAKLVELRETIAALHAAGFANLLDALVEKSSYTRCGRVAIAKVARNMQTSRWIAREQLKSAMAIAAL
jgi:hypothetical protein